MHKELRNSHHSQQNVHPSIFLPPGSAASVYVCLWLPSASRSMLCCQWNNMFQFDKESQWVSVLARQNLSSNHREEIGILSSTLLRSLHFTHQHGASLCNQFVVDSFPRRTARCHWHDFRIWTSSSFNPQSPSDVRRRQKFRVVCYVLSSFIFIVC